MLLSNSSFQFIDLGKDIENNSKGLINSLALSVYLQWMLFNVITFNYRLG